MFTSVISTNSIRPGTYGILSVLKKCYDICFRR